jgi:hypothetical protein
MQQSRTSIARILSARLEEAEQHLADRGLFSLEGLFYRQSQCRRHFSILTTASARPMQTADVQIPRAQFPLCPAPFVSPLPPLHPAASSLAGLFGQTSSMRCPFQDLQTTGMRAAASLLSTP